MDRDTGFLLPPLVDDWLPERHLARFVVEVIDRLDLSALRNSYRGAGSASYHPALLPGLLVYGYATGVFPSRKLERATYDNVAFRFIAANEHPDHDTIAVFRRRFLPQIEARARARFSTSRPSTRRRLRRAPPRQRPPARNSVDACPPRLSRRRSQATSST